ncbi:hypothetical protein EON63_06640 [archaeon]|nr:MAG: hypothetical protein EON63_06640 [archaeon]
MATLPIREPLHISLNTNMNHISYVDKGNTIYHTPYIIFHTSYIIHYTHPQHFIPPRSCW